jgi:hypothetical protein
MSKQWALHFTFHCQGILKGLSHEIEMSYKWNKSTEPNQTMNLFQSLKL